ncbi:MAG: hypothetical protein V1792_18805 [Pseudomonadota bacterium]
MILHLSPWNTLAQGDTPSAVVEAVQGAAYIVGPEEAGQQPLSQGNSVLAWKTVGTDDNGKLLLQWDGGFLTSVGSNSTLFVAGRETQQGTLADVQLIQGILRASSFGAGGGTPKPYALTTPIAAIAPSALDTEADFVVEVIEPTVTVLTVLKGSVGVKNLTLQGSEEVPVGPCRSVFVEEGKPVSEAAVVPADALEKLVEDATIAGTKLADVRVCGLGTTARQPRPAPTLPPDYSYVEDEDVDYYYPYDEIEVYPPDVAAGPMVIVLPGIGKWYLPYEVYHQWGFGPDLIRTYVSLVLFQDSLQYDYYNWNSLAARQREYYDVLYPAQLANNTMLIAQAQHQLDFVRIRQGFAARRIQNLQARVAGMEQALSQRGPVRASILTALYGSLNSPRNIQTARSFRHGVEGRWRIQEQLAGNASDELSNLRRRMARARDPQERLQMRDQMSQMRNVISAGKLPLPKKDGDIRNLLGQIPKTRDPEQLNNIGNQIARQLGQPRVMSAPDLVNRQQLEGLAKRFEKAAPSEAKRQAENRLQDLGRNVQRRMEIESAQKDIDRVVRQAAKTENEAKRAELLRTVPGLVKPGQDQFKGPLGHLREQQLLNSRIIGTPEKGKQAELDRRMRDFTKQQAEQLRLPAGRPAGEIRGRVQGGPVAEDPAGKRAEDLKKQAEDARRKAEQMLKRTDVEPRRGEPQRALEQERQTKERLERTRQAEEASRRARENAGQVGQRKAGDAERLRKERERAPQEAEIQRRRLDAVQKQKEEPASRQRMKEQQAEQTRGRDVERAKAQQQERQLRMQEDQRRKADEGARDRQRQEQSRQAEQERSREAERERSRQREQQTRQQQMEQQRALQQREQQQRQMQDQQQQQRMREQQRDQQMRQQQMEQQRGQQQQREQQQRQMQEQQQRRMQRP